MANPVTIRTLMSRRAKTITPHASLIEAANAMQENRLSGLPVVDANGALVGLLTEHDFLTKGSAIHLPTFLKLLEGLEVYQNDALAMNGSVKKILDMKVEDVMDSNPPTLVEGATIQEGLQIFAEHPHINPIPVIDASKKVVGVLSRSDIIKMFAAPRSRIFSNGRRSVDREVDSFLADFENEFLLVEKSRTRYWLLYSILFAVVGFIIAFALIVQFGSGR